MRLEITRELVEKASDGPPLKQREAIRAAIEGDQEPLAMWVSWAVFSRTLTMAIARDNWGLNIRRRLHRLIGSDADRRDALAAITGPLVALHIEIEMPGEARG